MSIFLPEEATTVVLTCARRLWGAGEGVSQSVLFTRHWLAVHSLNLTHANNNTTLVMSTSMCIGGYGNQEITTRQA